MSGPLAENRQIFDANILLSLLVLTHESVSLSYDYEL